MRFRLRTLQVVFLLLCLSAPWWPNTYHSIKRWISAPPPIQRPLGNIVNKAELTAVVRRARPGMTIAEIDQVFGFKSGAIYSAGQGVTRTYWTFQIRDNNYGSSVSYVGTFKAGRLDKDGLYMPL
jgi:hypothetical protein